MPLSRATKPITTSGVAAVRKAQATSVTARPAVEANSTARKPKRP